MAGMACRIQLGLEVCSGAAVTLRTVQGSKQHQQAGQQINKNSAPTLSRLDALSLPPSRAAIRKRTSKNQASTFLSVSCPDADGTGWKGVCVEPSGRMYSEASTTRWFQPMWSHHCRQSFWSVMYSRLSRPS